MKKPLSLYIHIPFCVRKCAYCDFLSTPASEQVREEYVQALCSEIHDAGLHFGDYQLETLFLGGGTPTVLTGEQLCRIISEVKRGFNYSTSWEASLECNPGTATEEKLQSLVKAGFNRISIGLQSAEDRELALLGRVHSFQDFLATYHAAQRAGFQRINVDLMSALPGQTLESWEKTLRTVIALEPEHISAYSLIVEEGTPFYAQYGWQAEEIAKYGEVRSRGQSRGQSLSGCLPAEEEERAMYHRTREILEDNNYTRYEISNYAKAGGECRHNLVYWQRGDYLGLGLGASSMVDNVRWKECEDLGRYLDRWLNCASSDCGMPDHMQPGHTSAKTAQSNVILQEGKQRLSTEEQMEEFMFLGLRTMNGVSVSAFEHAFGRSMQQVYGEKLRTLTAQGYLVRAADRLRLTEAGIDVSNQILAEFLFD